MHTLTVQELRDIVEESILNSIQIHRDSRANYDDKYDRPNDARPTDEEIDDFLLTNPLLDTDAVEQLTDPGFLGFHATTAKATEEWLDKFTKNINSWASTNEWLGGDLVFYHTYAGNDYEPISTEIWKPNDKLIELPSFISNSPSHLILAEKLLREGRLLHEMDWRKFEKLIAELLITNGWNVELMKGSKDGGIDIIADRKDPILGSIRSVWQAKRYSSRNKVQLHHIRELSGVVDRERVTKGIIVTTSSLTHGALDWVQKDNFRLDAKDGKYIEKWVKQRIYEF